VIAARRALAPAGLQGVLRYFALRTGPEGDLALAPAGLQGVLRKVADESGLIDCGAGTCLPASAFSARGVRSPRRARRPRWPLPACKAFSASPVRPGSRSVRVLAPAGLQGVFRKTCICRTKA